jgi:hypothetical protein
MWRVRRVASGRAKVTGRSALSVYVRGSQLYTSTEEEIGLEDEAGISRLSKTSELDLTLMSAEVVKIHSSVMIDAMGPRTHFDVGDQDELGVSISVSGRHERCQARMLQAS